MKYSEKEIEDLLDGIYSGAISEYNIPEELYFSITDYLKSGLYKGFGGNLTDFEGKDLELLQELRENVYMFGAAKSFQEMKDIGSLMFDEDGNRVSSKEFNSLGSQAFEKWNYDWGRTEYNTCAAQATMAVKWNEIEANKDLLPILSYSTIGDACDICEPLDGFTAPVDDPAWNSIMPVNHFNCECTVTQHEEKELTPDKEKEEILDAVHGEMSDVFKMNPGKDGYIFSPDHPYFDVAPKDEAFAKTNFGLPIPTVEEETGGKVSGFIEAKTINEARRRIREIIVAESGLNIDKVSVSSTLSMPQINARLNTIESLFKEYNINPIIDRSIESNVVLKSTDRLDGFIKYQYNKGQNKASIKTINFGDRSADSRAVVFDPAATKIRRFSRVDKENVDIATVVHEFGHIISIDLGGYIKNQPAWYNEFNADLRDIRTRYRNELLKLNKARNMAEINELSLGAYSGTNIDEFLAEGFAEYKLSSNPSKYATEIGKLIDKNFKK